MNDETSSGAPSGAIDAVAALAEPTRRRLYDWVARERRAVGRDEAAAALGLGRPLAAFHLDRLVEVGLLETEYRRLSGRSGPGAGRPAKLYRRSAGEVAVSLPERRYELAARVLADGLERAAGEAGEQAVRAAAERQGRRLGGAARGRLGGRASARRRRTALVETLTGAGYAPQDAGSEIRFANCPYDALVADHRPLICAANAALAGGLLDELGPLGLEARLDPRPGWCCVVIGRPLDAGRGD